MEELTINSKEKNALYKVQAQIEDAVSEYELSFNLTYLIDFIIEEIFVNIVKHGYNNKEGIIKIQYEVLNNPLKLHLTFIDDAPMFNPLKADEPNLTEDIDQRKEGNLGIYLVEQYADDLDYEYLNNQNVFSIVKVLEEE